MVIKRKKRILVIDDESDILETIADYLKSANMEVISCTNPIEAMKIVDNNNIDAVVTDYKMPQKNGLQCINYIKKVKGPTFPIIVMTGTNEIDENIVVKGGGKALLQKPLDFKELQDTLKKEIECQLINPNDFRSIEIKSYALGSNGTKEAISLVDFDDDYISVEGKKGRFKKGEEYSFSILCNSLKASMDIQFGGIIFEVQNVDDKVDMIIIHTQHHDDTDFGKFREVLARRQEEILEFLKMSKGF